MKGKSLAICFSLAWAGSIPSSACDNGVAIVSGGTNYPPLTWLKGNELAGASVDLVREILERKNIRVISDGGAPWKRILRRAKSGEVDIVIGFQKSPDREQYLYYVEPALSPAVQSVFYAVDRPISFNNWDDLKGKRGSMTLGEDFDKTLSDYISENLNMEYVPRVQQNFEKLARNRVDYVLGPMVPMQLYARQYGFENKIVNAEKPLTVIQEYIAISKKSSCMKHADYVSKEMVRLSTPEHVTDLMAHSFEEWLDFFGKKSEAVQ